MTKDDRKRVGARLRAMRALKGLDQIAVAKHPRVKIAVGTLQAIESGTRETRESKIEKVARFFGTTLEELRQDEERVTPADPLFAGMNREDLFVAHSYHDAPTIVRQRAQALLRDGEADIAIRIDALDLDLRQTITEFVKLQENAQRDRGSQPTQKAKA